jgi:hypothetical protein
VRRTCSPSRSAGATASASPDRHQQLLLRSCLNQVVFKCPTTPTISTPTSN